MRLPTHLISPWTSLVRAVAFSRRFTQPTQVLMSRKQKSASNKRHKRLSRREVSRRWDTPVIESVEELAGYFSTTPKTLLWLAAVAKTSHPGTHYHSKWIRKRVGHRLIESPLPQLKSVQRAILTDILNPIPVSNFAHAYCKKRNTKSFVAMHTGRGVCLKMDLRQFFPSIESRRVGGIFRSLNYPRPVTRLLTGLCTTIAKPDDIRQLKSMSTSGQQLNRFYATRHLPQGAPTSPMLANLIAFRLDCRLDGLVRPFDGRYSRYADDLLFSFPRDDAHDRQCRNRLRRLSHRIAAIAIEEGFEVNYRKTRVMFRSQRQMATGLILNEKPNCVRKKYDQLKATLHNCIHSGPESQNRDNHPYFQAHLKGQIQWIAYLNPARGEKLNQQFERIQW